MPDIEKEYGTAWEGLQAEEIQSRPKNACQRLEKPHCPPRLANLH